MTAVTPDVLQPAKPARRAASSRALLSVGAAVAAALAGAAYIALPKDTVTTDAAYLEADSATVAPKVRGLISDVLVRDNQPVKRGDPLIRIDTEEFDARVSLAEAEVLNARAGLAAAKAALTALDADERLAASQVKVAETAISAADAQSERAQAERARFDRLASYGAVSSSEVDEHRAAAVTAQSEARRARAALAVSRDQVGATQAKRSALVARVAEAEAGVARAQAALELARQDQAHGAVAAPIDGVIGDRHAEPGDYVQPGTRLMTIVPVQAVYVVANFKETQTARMLPGQKARIAVDALPGQPLTGTVESLAPGSGSTFSLLPFEPGTGNFTKIVQRVPVRIRLDPGQPAATRLRPGLSSKVSVRLKD